MDQSPVHYILVMAMFWSTPNVFGLKKSYQVKRHVLKILKINIMVEVLLRTWLWNSDSQTADFLYSRNNSNSLSDEVAFSVVPQPATTKFRNFYFSSQALRLWVLSQADTIMTRASALAKTWAICKVLIFWEGHKILWNIHHRFDH